MRKIFCLWAMAMVLFVGEVMAEDLDKGLSVAMRNIPAGADGAGMGNAWTATPNFSSNNPAVLTAFEMKNAGFSASYGIVNFGKGPSVNFYSLAGGVKLPVGVFQFSYGEGGSDKKVYEKQFDETGGHIYEAEFKSFEDYDFQYGLKVAENILVSGDKLHLGVGYNYATSKMAFGADVGTPATTFSSKLDAESRSHSWSAGGVYQPNGVINLGVFYSKSYDRNTDSSIWEGLAEKENYDSRSSQLRLGVGVQITPQTFIAADYQHLKMPEGYSDQLFAGIEQAIINDILYVYAGWAGDGPTGGIGLYFENGGLNASYMHDTNDLLSDSLGKTDIWMFSGYFDF